MECNKIGRFFPCIIFARAVTGCIGVLLQTSILCAAYWDVYKQFDPRAFNAKKLVQTMKQGGIRYAGLTTKHHEGFCMFDKLTADFKITSRQCPYASRAKLDITAAFYEAVNKAGLETLFYFSKSDWDSLSLARVFKVDSCRIFP